MVSDLNEGLSKKTFVFGLRVWVLTGIIVTLLIVVILLVLSICLTSRKRSRRAKGMIPLAQIPNVSREIKEIGVDHISPNNHAHHNGTFLSLDDKYSEKECEKELEKVLINSKMGDNNSSPSGSFTNINKEGAAHHSGEEGGLHIVSVHHKPSPHPITAPSPLSGLPEFSHLGWGHWFTLRDLELATNWFSKENVIGEGGYGVVYRGNLINGTPVAVKKLLNNL